MARLLDNIFDYLRFGGNRRNVTSTKTVGASGTAVYGGYIQEDETSARLVGRQKYRTYSNMLANVEIVATGVRYFLNLLAKASWNVEPADDSDQAKEIAEAIEDMIHGMDTSWARVIRRAGMYRFYGFSIQEWTAKRREDGLIGLADIAPRPQLTIERWNVNELDIVN